MEVQLGTPHLIGYLEEASVNSLALSPSGERVIVAGCSPVVQVWDVVPRFPIHESFAEVLQAFRDAKSHLSLSAQDSTAWERFVNHVAFSASDETVLLGLANGDVEMWDIESTRLLARYHKDGFVYDGELDALASSPDDRLVVVAGDCPGQVLAWNRATGACTWQAETYKWTYALAISPHSQFVAAATWDGRIHLWNGKDGRSLVDNALWVEWGYPYRNTCFFASQFSPSGEILAVAGVDGEGWRGCIHLFDPRTQSHIRELSGHSRGVHALAFSPSDPLLASGGKDGILRLWSVESGQQVACFDLGALALPMRDEQTYQVTFARRFYSDPEFLPSAIHALAFAANGQFLVIGTHSGAIVRMDVALV